MKWHQNGDLGVWIPGIGSKFRSESNGDGPEPQNSFFWGVGKSYINFRYTTRGEVMLGSHEDEHSSKMMRARQHSLKPAAYGYGLRLEVT